MRIAILSDAHGNAYSFLKCVNYIRRNFKIDKYFYLGDVVGYLPEGDLIVDYLQDLEAECVLGNHDAMLLGYLKTNKDKDSIYKIKSSKSKMQEKHLTFMKKWTPFKEINIMNRKLLFVHGSPWDPLNGYIYPDSNIEIFKELEYDAVFMGHTHRPFISTIQNMQIVNVGSCGLPRDQGNMLSFAIYDITKNECSIYRLPVNIEYIIQLYNDIDETVINCLNRKSNYFFGDILGGNHE